MFIYGGPNTPSLSNNRENSANTPNISWIMIVLRGGGGRTKVMLGVRKDISGSFTNAYDGIETKGLFMP